MHSRGLFLAFPCCHWRELEWKIAIYILDNSIYQRGSRRAGAEKAAKRRREIGNSFGCFLQSRPQGFDSKSLSSGIQAFLSLSTSHGESEGCVLKQA